MALDPLADRISELLEAGSIVRSRLSRAMRSRVEVLFHIGALADVKSGAGQRVVLRDRDALIRWVRSEYPSGLHGTKDDLPTRAESVANFRDSKRGRRLAVHLVYMRGFGDAILRCKDDVMPLAEMTRAYSVAGILVDPERPWTLDGVLALVENLEVFLHVENVVPGIDAALWTAGRVDQRVLGWLATQVRLEVLHVGDYDPVGLDEYLRVKNAFGERADLHVPDDLQERVARYGQTPILVRSVAVLKRVRRQADDRVRSVLTALDRYGRGLEQEALSIRVPSDE